MTGSKKRSPAEAWDALEKMADDEEVERVLALSDEELDKELADAGFDPEKVRAQGQALGERLARESAPAIAPALATGAAVVPIRPRRSTTMRVFTLMAATLSVLVVLVGVLPRVHDWLHPPVDVGAGQKPTPAQAMREKAFLACDAQRYAECLRLLDDARATDPGGDRMPQVEEYRQRAESGLKNVLPAPTR